MTDYLEEFRERLRQIDEDHAARMAQIDRDDRRLKWVFGLIVGAAFACTLVEGLWS